MIDSIEPAMGKCGRPTNKCQDQMVTTIASAISKGNLARSNVADVPPCKSHTGLKKANTNDHVGPLV